MSIEKMKFLSTKDFSVSQEKFELLYNSELELLETFPRPDPESIGKYYESDAYISHTDSKKSLIDKLYQWVKRFTLSRKLVLVESFNPKKKTLLDIGCGTGDFLLKCSRNNWDVSGVEPNRNAKKLASEKLDGQNTGTIVETIQDLGDSKYHVITLWHVLEHVQDLENYIETIKKHLHKNGHLIVAVPNYKSYDAVHYKEYWAAYDVPRHLWHFSKNAIKNIFLQRNMELHKIRPMYFDAFYVALLSEQYKNKKGNFLKAFFVGCLSNFKALTTKEYSSLIYVLKLAKN